MLFDKLSFDELSWHQIKILFNPFSSRFEQTFSPDLRFNVRFTVPRLPIMLQHRAVKTLASGPLKHLLFPNLDSDQMLSESRLV